MQTFREPAACCPEASADGHISTTASAAPLLSTSGTDSVELLSSCVETGPLRTFLHWLALTAFCAQALLPNGIMVVAAGQGQGSQSIVICTGHGPLTVDVDGTGIPAAPKKTSEKSDTCPYAAAHMAATKPEPAALAETVRYASVVYRLLSLRFDATPEVGAQSARGPPAILV